MRDLAGVAVAVVAAGLWQGAAVVSLLLLFFRVVPRVSATVRSAVWAGAFALLAAIPLLHFGLRSGGAGTGEMAQQGAAEFHLQPVWGYGLLVMWAGLVLLRAVRLLRHATELRRMWRRAAPMQVPREVAELLQSGGRSAELCRSADVDAPLVIGFVRPRLLLPEALADEIETGDLQQIALHEMEHLRRRDDWVNLMQKLALVGLPLHPGLVWIDRRLGRERELACDAGVVANTKAPVRYAACLARLAEHRLRGRMAALSLAAWTRRPELVRRVETLLQPVRGLTPLQSRVVMGLLLVALGVGATEMARAPRLVALDEPAVRVGGSTLAAATRVTGVPEAVPAGYRVSTMRGEAIPRPVMRQAMYVMPEAPTAKAADRRPKHRTAVARKNFAATGARREREPEMLGRQGRARVVLTGAPEEPPVYTLTIQRVPSYAAVPFGGGWLLIQL